MFGIEEESWFYIVYCANAFGSDKVPMARAMGKAMAQLNMQLMTQKSEIQKGRG
jgi:hypothetical protein